MAIVTCKKGHYYDTSITNTCPQCARENGENAMKDNMKYGATNMDDYGKTEPVAYAGGTGVDDYGKTEPVAYAGATGMGDYGKTEPVGFGGGTSGIYAPFEETQPPVGGNGFETGDFKHRGMVDVYDEPTAGVVMNNTAGFAPVTGWLVCIEGPARGCDYRIRPGYNYIGRADHMEICIHGDNKIGRERHAMIAYDHEERVFFFGPADGKSIVRRNNKMVMVPEMLQAYDVLTIGSTKLMFVPLCGERFNWE